MLKVAFCNEYNVVKKNEDFFVVALFFYLTRCKNMQTAQQKVTSLIIVVQFCGVTSVAK